MLTECTSCYKNTITDKTLTYASEIWILTNRDRKQINYIEEFYAQYMTKKKKIGEY
jgi:hypothetical protein